MRLHRLDLRRHQRQQLRHQRIEPLEVREQVLDVVGRGVDAVERVEHRPHRPADRDVVAVRFPVEVVADRAEEVVEIGDVVPQFGDVDGHVAGLARPCCAWSHSSRPSARSSGHRVDGRPASRRPASSMSAMRSCRYLRFRSWPMPPILICAGMVLNFNGFAVGAGDRLDPADARAPGRWPWRSCRSPGSPPSCAGRGRSR